MEIKRCKNSFKIEQMILILSINFLVFSSVKIYGNVLKYLVVNFTAICSDVCCLKDLKMKSFSTKEGIVSLKISHLLSGLFFWTGFLRGVLGASKWCTHYTCHTTSHAQKHPACPTYLWECCNIGSLFCSFC